jgi:hypothetical protein
MLYMLGCNSCCWWLHDDSRQQQDMIVHQQQCDSQEMQKHCRWLLNSNKLQLERCGIYTAVSAAHALSVILVAGGAVAQD